MRQAISEWSVRAFHGEMFPFPSRRNALDTGLAHVKQFCQIHARVATCRVHVPDCHDLSLGEFSALMVFTTKPLSNPSPLFPRIFHVISGCAFKQMLGVAARRVVASVTNHHRIWDWPILQFVRKSVRQPPTPRWSFYWSKHPISTLVSITHKWPAVIRLPYLDFCPKTLAHWNALDLPPSAKRTTLFQRNVFNRCIGICECHIARNLPYKRQTIKVSHG